MESLCPEVGSDKWLMGGDELTLLDTTVGSMWVFFYLLIKAPVFSHVA